AAGEEVCRFVTALGDLGRARLAEVDQILRSIGAGAEGTERVTRAELLERARTGSVVVLDVRPAEEYAAGHIPGARSLPLEHLEARLDELDPTLDVVAYCRGPLCLLAPEAVARLRARGLKARCLEDGLPEWRQAGLPVATAGAAEPLTGTDPQASRHPAAMAPTTRLSAASSPPPSSTLRRPLPAGSPKPAGGP
ncbi:MAG: rhodanese-like domain-containing protein, partial [Acidimicrobiales bacterium]